MGSLVGSYEIPQGLELLERCKYRSCVNAYIAFLTKPTQPLRKIMWQRYLALSPKLKTYADAEFGENWKAYCLHIC